VEPIEEANGRYDRGGLRREAQRLMAAGHVSGHDLAARSRCLDRVDAHKIAPTPTKRPQCGR